MSISLFRLLFIFLIFAKNNAMVGPSAANVAEATAQINSLITKLGLLAKFDPSNPNKKIEANGGTVLHLMVAIEEHHHVVIILSTFPTIDLCATNDTGETVLHEAVIKDSMSPATLAILKAILEHAERTMTPQKFIDFLNIRDNEGLTALALAQSVREGLSFGAEIHAAFARAKEALTLKKLS